MIMSLLLNSYLFYQGLQAETQKQVQPKQKQEVIQMLADNYDSFLEAKADAYEWLKKIMLSDNSMEIKKSLMQQLDKELDTKKLEFTRQAMQNMFN